MLFIEGAAGMSGDMTVGALLSLGASAERLKETLDSLKLGDEFSYVISEKSSYGIAGTDFDVILPHHHHHHPKAGQPDETCHIRQRRGAARGDEAGNRHHLR